MRKYRCPYCGEEGITASKKAFQFNTPRARRGLQMKYGCPSCDKKYMLQQRYPLSQGSGLLSIALSISLLLSAALFIIAVLFENYSVIFTLTFFVFVIMLIVMPLWNLKICGITQFNDAIQQNVLLPPNATVELTTSTRRIDNLDILGVRFSEKTRKVRFAEAFRGEIVPVVFYKKSKDQAPPLQVTFMKAEFIPAELLHEGAQFTVVDNGEDIATGTIVKLLQDDET